MACHAWSRGGGEPRLPGLQAGGAQPVHEGVRVLAQLARAVRPRQRRGVQDRPCAGSKSSMRKAPLRMCVSGAFTGEQVGHLL